jgi:hypothetical protein
MFSSRGISYFLYGAMNIFTNINEVLDEGRERDKCCGYGQRVHGSSEVVRDEWGKEDLESAPAKHSFNKNSSHSSNLTVKGSAALTSLQHLIPVKSQKITNGIIPGSSPTRRAGSIWKSSK